MGRRERIGRRDGRGYWEEECGKVEEEEKRKGRRGEEKSIV
jgi:hypothetical protein